MANHEQHRRRPTVAIIGSGPAALAAAEALCGSADVQLFEAMPSAGRKFLLAGRSGLNITHGEPLERFLDRFGTARTFLEPALRAFPPDAIRDWAGALGIDTFVGSSGRVFPVRMKASPLLRAWLARLATAGVGFHFRHRWRGWTQSGALQFETPAGPREFDPAATVLALGGASWPRLGSDGTWTTLLRDRGVAVAPLRPANCGFDVDWSVPFRERFAGTPLKSVMLNVDGACVRGDCVVTARGIEGSAIYSLAAPLRDRLEREGSAELRIDLSPDRSLERLHSAMIRPRGKTSLSNHLRKSTGLSALKLALLRELLDRDVIADPARLATGIKRLPVRVVATRPLAEAISSAGGIPLGELDADYRLTRLGGTFAAGEMLDWEAPTGGYLLTACLASGRAAGLGVTRWLDRTARGIRSSS